MAITRLNHAVLYVRDIERSLAFYCDVLGFRPISMLPDGFHGAAFLQAPGSTNDHDLGLFAIGEQAGASGAGRTTVGLYHLAWEVETLSDLAELAEKLTAGRRLGRSQRPQHHEEPLRQRPGRHRAGDRLDRARRATSTTPRSPAAARSSGSTCRPRSSGTARRPAAASASPSPPRPEPCGRVVSATSANTRL